MPPPNITQHRNTGDWRVDVRSWIHKHWYAFDSVADEIVSFFELVFWHTRCVDRAWFGLHKSAVSLVVGGIYLAAIHKQEPDKGFWLLLDQDPPMINGVHYKPVQATKESQYPLIWAWGKLSSIPDLVSNHLIWTSFASASEKILYCPRYPNDRDSVQERRGKLRLTSLKFTTLPLDIFPNEVNEGRPVREGAMHEVLVNAYERDPGARKRCIEHHGTGCSVCGILFEAVYGDVAKGFIHVHHLKPLSEIGSEYTLDPVKDLRPVCPNCHAVIHLRKPAFSILEVMEFLSETQADCG